MVKMVKWLENFMDKRLILLIVAIILWRQVIPLANLVKNFPLNDFGVYLDGAKAALAGDNPYTVKFFDRYNYSPAGTLFFIPFTLMPVNLAELIFTLMSIISLWISVRITLNLVGMKPPPIIFWLLFALSLKTFPAKLTLSLGQINLIILGLLLFGFWAHVNHKNSLSGILLGLAVTIKLTPLSLVIYYLFRKQWKSIFWFTATLIGLTAIGIIVFGMDLSLFYWTKTVPGLMAEITPSTINASYMNQSMTALLARMGIFGNLNSLIRLGTGLIWGIIVIKIIKAEETRNDFVSYWSLVIVTMLILPVFVWQHHYTILIPVWIVLIAKFIQTKKFKDLATVGLTYFLLIFYIKDPYLPLQLNPFLSSHFLTSGLIFLILSLKSFGPDQKQIPDGQKFFKQNSCR